MPLLWDFKISIRDIINEYYGNFYMKQDRSFIHYSPYFFILVPKNNMEKFIFEIENYQLIKLSNCSRVLKTLKRDIDLIYLELKQSYFSYKPINFQIRIFPKPVHPPFCYNLRKVKIVSYQILRALEIHEELYEMDNVNFKNNFLNYKEIIFTLKFVQKTS